MFDKSPTEKNEIRNVFSCNCSDNLMLFNMLLDAHVTKTSGVQKISMFLRILYFLFNEN